MKWLIGRTEKIERDWLIYLGLGNPFKATQNNTMTIIYIILIS